MGMTVPDGTVGPYARATADAVALHELIHARHSRAMSAAAVRRHGIHALQGWEDARVHTEWWPLAATRQQCRDALVMCLVDMRALARRVQEIRTDTDAWNASLVVALRSLAIATRLGTRAQRDYVRALAERVHGERVAELLDGHVLPGIRRSKKKHDREYYLSLYSSLFRLPPPHPSLPAPGAGRDEDGRHPRMAVVDLPRTVPTDPERRMAPSRVGRAPRLGRMAALVTRFDATGLFVRRRPQPPATTAVVIDGSGSMGVEPARLAAICARVPGALVGVYSDYGRHLDRRNGTLVIFARDGMRAESLEYVDGGNGVDLHALRYLLAQPCPNKIFVSDGEFCGGASGEADAALALATGKEASGEILWLRSISDLAAHFGIA